MKPLRLVLAEDDPLARKHLARCVEAAGGVEIVAVCEDGREALAAIERHRPDVAVLDIVMPHLSGVEVARALADGRLGTGVVFTTAHAEFAARAFDLDVVDFVLKPFDAPRIARSLERMRRCRRASAAPESAELGVETLSRAVGVANLRGRRLMLRSSGRIKVVDIADIRYVSSEGDYCTVSFGRESMLARHVLKDLEVRLADCGFLRIHRRVLINVGHLREVRPWRHGDHEFVMKDGTVFQSGPTYRLQVQRFLETKSAI